MGSDIDVGVMTAEARTTRKTTFSWMQKVDRSVAQARRNV